MLKFYTDENVHVSVAKALKERGVDIITARDAGMLHKNDEAQLAFAEKQKRVLVTHDQDFLSLKANHYGIMFFTKQISVGQYVEEIELVHLDYSPEDLKNTVSNFHN